jgi:hypothetical protein
MEAIEYNKAIDIITSKLNESYFNNYMQGSNSSIDVDYFTIFSISTIYNKSFNEVSKDIDIMFHNKKEDLKSNKNWNLAVNGKYQF